MAVYKGIFRADDDKLWTHIVEADSLDEADAKLVAHADGQEYGDHELVEIVQYDGRVWLNVG